MSHVVCLNYHTWCLKSVSLFLAMKAPHTEVAVIDRPICVNRLSQDGDIRRATVCEIYTAQGRPLSWYVGWVSLKVTLNKCVNIM